MHDKISAVMSLMITTVQATVKPCEANLFSKINIIPIRIICSNIWAVEGVITDFRAIKYPLMQELTLINGNTNINIFIAGIVRTSFSQYFPIGSANRRIEKVEINPKTIEIKIYL